VYEFAVQRGLVDRAASTIEMVERKLTYSNRLDNSNQGCRLFMGCRRARSFATFIIFPSRHS
jgi:hypothetical protein